MEMIDPPAVEATSHVGSDTSRGWLADTGLFPNSHESDRKLSSIWVSNPVPIIGLIVSRDEFISFGRLKLDFVFVRPFLKRDLNLQLPRHPCSEVQHSVSTAGPGDIFLKTAVAYGTQEGEHVDEVGLARAIGAGQHNAAAVKLKAEGFIVAEIAEAQMFKP